MKTRKQKTTRVAAIVSSAALGAGLLLSVPSHPNAATVTPPQAAPKAKNVIFFLGDGMGATPVTAARIYKYGEGGKLTLETFPRAAQIRTFSLDAQTADSAPSMAAYMTGVRMRNEVLSMSPETVASTTNPACNPFTAAPGVPSNGTPVPTLFELAKASGKSVGAITTTELTHATPAATYSHICHRNLAYDIAAQAVPGGVGANPAVGDGFNVLMGGGRNHFVPTSAGVTNGRPDGRNLLTELGAQGYTVATDRAGFDAIPATASKVIGLFSANSHLNYELDRDPTKQPSLKEMTVKAIDVLTNASDKGFFLMVEGGRIDHALHGGNAKRALVDTIAFDDAIAAALAKVNLDDTMIVVTADHDHTMVINGYSKRGNPILDISYDFLTGAPSLDADGLTYPVLAFGNGPGRQDIRTATTSAQATADGYLQPSAIRLGSETHGGADVMLTATGPGTLPFKGTMDNVKVFGIIKVASGL